MLHSRSRQDRGVRVQDLRAAPATENRRCGKIAMRRATKTATPGKRESLTNFESKMLSLALPGGY